MLKFNAMHTETGQSMLTWVGQDGKSRTVTGEQNIYIQVKRSLVDGVYPDDIFDNAKPAIFGDERIQYDSDGFRFNSETVPVAVGDVILRYEREGRDAMNLIKFMDRLSKNPSLRSREMLFTWTQAQNIVIDDEGFIIGYKGVRTDMLSCHAGPAEVDGVAMNGHIPNMVGTVISMPREKVNHDPRTGCSTGLHVGNFDYAKGFGAIVLEVRVDPADVVSVPKDCAFQKMRCCRYEVVAIHESDKDDVAETYEPEATLNPTVLAEELDSFADLVPEKFLTGLRKRMAVRFGRKPKDEQEDEV